MRENCINKDLPELSTCEFFPVYLIIRFFLSNLAGINLHFEFFKKAEIALAKAARSISAF